MVRETRHLWVGNLPDNIREDRIREHFKRYGRVQSVKLLPRCSKEDTGENAMACTVAFMDIKSASKARDAEHKIDDKTLTTEYYEPVAIPSAALPPNAPSSYSTSPGNTRFPNGHGPTDDHGNFSERFYDRTTGRVPETEYIRSRSGYHENNTRGRNRDRPYRNGPYNNIIDRAHRLNSTPWPSSYDPAASSATATAGANSGRYNNQNSDTGYSTAPSETNERRTETTSSTKKKTKSRSGSRSPTPSGSNSSRSASRSRSRSSSSSSSSSTSRDTSSTSSPRSRRTNHQEDRRPLAICVKNLPCRSSDTSLKDGLFHEYKKHGKVTSVKVVGQSSERHAIVCFKKPEDAEKALEVSYDKLFFGSKIEVAPYQGHEVDDGDSRLFEAEIDEFSPKATRTLFIGNLEKDVTASDIRKHFDQYGEIIEIDIKKQGAVSSYAFCQYSDIVSVVKAIRALDGEHLGNNRIKLGFGKSMATSCVWVDGVTENVSEKYLMNQFETFGSIQQVNIDREKGQALIFYEQVVHAQAAVSKMRGVTLGRNRKIQVDFASRECQNAFYDHLEKQGHVTNRIPFEERRDSSTSRNFDATTNSSRFSRYDTPTRPRASSYSNRANASTNQLNSTTVPSPSGTPGSVTPRTASSRSRVSRYPADYYDQGSEYGERHFRSYDEYSQGSGASHDEPYDHDYSYHESPSSHLEPIERLPSSASDHPGSFPAPDIRNLQKERVHILEQLDDCSSGDEIVCPKKKIKLDHLDGTMNCDVIIEANRDHRKVIDVRRLSDVGKHHSRRPSVDSKHRELTGHDRNSYLPHSICKRRKTGGSDNGSRIHHYDQSGSESVGGSRPGTPLCDEKPEHVPTEPRRTPRDREGPLSLPLPRFAAQVLHKGSISVAGIKGQKDNILSSPPAAVTSPRIANPKPPSPVHVPPPASPPPRPSSLSPSSCDSDASLDERIRSLDEKYEKWSGSRALSASGGDALAKLDANREKFKIRHKLLDLNLDLKVLQPSEIVKSVMAKRSVFDEDSKRLENVSEKYEPREFSPFPKTTTAVTQSSVPATPLATSTLLKISTTQLPKTPTILSPRSTSTGITPAKGLQYPFPSHPPVQPTPAIVSTSLLASIQTVTTSTVPSTFSTASTTCTTTVTTSRTVAHSENNRLKQCSTNGGDERTTSKVSSVNSNKTNNSVLKGGDIKCGIPMTGGESDKQVTNTVKNRRDSAASSGSDNATKSRRNSECNSVRLGETCDSADTDIKLEHEREKVERERDKIERERQERRERKEREEQERREREECERKEREERERREREEREQQERKERERKEREERERKEREERERKEKEERERKEREERERKDREERERKEREERERKEKEERERKEREDRERKEREERERKEREERDRRDREERERKEREERERREREEKERREREDKEKREQLEKERLEKERTERLEREKAQEKEKLEKEKLDRDHERQKEKEREKEKERRREHKEDNHEKHRHRENHSEKHRENHSDVKKEHEVRKDHDSRNHEIREQKSKHHSDRDSERRKENTKENRENNTFEKSKNNIEIKEGKDRPSLETRHLSIDLDKNRQIEAKGDPSRRKERNNSLPGHVTSKRRLSDNHNHDENESKKLKLEKKITERRSSKDNREDKIKKYKSLKSHDERREKHNSIDEKRKDREHKKKSDKQKSKSKEKSREKESPSTPGKELEKEFLNRLELIETEKQKQRKDKDKEKRKQHLQEDDERRGDERKVEDRKMEDRKIDDRKIDDRKLDDRKLDDRKLDDRKMDDRKMDDRKIDDRKMDDRKMDDRKMDDRKMEERKFQSKPREESKNLDFKAIKKERIRKFTNSSDNNTDSDEPKKHSIFDIVDDEPAYISMYDKVKARSCKNMQKQEEEKRQEKIKAKFSQLKQSRAKREEKKRSTSWDEDSDSDRERSETKEIRRKSKMLIQSSDEENDARKKRMYSDSDSERNQIKNFDTSDDDHIKNLQRKGSKSRITSDTSDDDFKTAPTIKSEIFSDHDDQTYDFYKKIKEEPEDKYIKKEKKNSKHQEDINVQIFGEASSADEEERKQLEIRKKHKKKQKKQKSSVSDESVKEEIITQSDDKVKRKQHSKKDKKRDKSKDELRDKSKKSRKIKDNKRDGKMENIFGSLSDDSENGKDQIPDDHKAYMRGPSEDTPQYASDSDGLTVTEKDMFNSEEMMSKERNLKEEHRKRKEKKRREKEKQRRREEINENSIDFSDLGKQLEDNIKDDSNDCIAEIKAEVKVEAEFKFEVEDQEYKKEERKENKEKKKKRKKSKDEKQRHHHHHHHHHEKNKIKDVVKQQLPLQQTSLPQTSLQPTPAQQPLPREASPASSSKIDALPILEESPVKELEKPCLPSLDIPSPPQCKPPSLEVQPPTTVSPVPTTPSKEKKKFIPGFGSEIDEKIHENAVKSISEFEQPKGKPEIKEEIKDEKVEGNDEKPRVVISQEETEDAVAALLGESFGGGQFVDYDQQISPVSAPVIPEENNVQDDEEMRQAVQSLHSTELDIKPETPQSENDLQIDTDPEDQEEISMRFDQLKTPEVELPRTPKTPDGDYFKTEELQKQKPLVIKSNLGSPPSLTPIKNLPDKFSLPVPSERSQGWKEEKKSDELRPAEVESKVSPAPLLQVVDVSKTKEAPKQELVKSPKNNPPTIKSPSPSAQSHVPFSSQKQDFGLLSPKNMTRLPISTGQIVAKPLQTTNLVLQQAKVAQSLEKFIPNDLRPFSNATTSRHIGFLQNQQQRVVLQQPPTPPTAPVYKSYRLAMEGAIEKPKEPMLTSVQNYPPMNMYAKSQPLQIEANVNITVAEVPLSPRPLPSQFQPKPLTIQSTLAIQQPPIALGKQQSMQAIGLQPTQTIGIQSTQALGVQSSQPLTIQTVQPQQPLSIKPTQTISIQSPKSLSTQSPKSLSIQPIQPQTVQPPQIILPPIKPISAEAKPYMPVIQETSKAEMRSPIIIQQTPKALTVDVGKVEVRESVGLLKIDETRTSTPSPVIVMNRDVKTEPVREPTPPKESTPNLLAIEKVTEELNMTLEKEKIELEQEKEKTEAIVPPTPEPQEVKEEVEEPARIETEVKIEEKEPKPEVEAISVIKEIEKIDEEKADTDSVVSDISKERLSAEILCKDDPLDSKEDSDYWSAKEVNIDSVIKKVDALCSADELSDRSSEIGKDDWFEEHKITKSVEEKHELEIAKSPPQEVHDFEDNAETVESKEVSIRGGRRGGRSRAGRKTRGVDRLGVQTRRAKVKETTTALVPRRGGGRGGRTKTERKVAKSESEAAGDIYEFRDDSDDAKDRPRLILTIKPIVANSSGNSQLPAAHVKEVIKPTATPTQKAENKEEFVSPAANTRKSKRLQEKDVSKNTVDDTIEDVIKNSPIQTRSQTPRRSARQTIAKATPDTPVKGKRGPKKKDRRASETTDDSAEEKKLEAKEQEVIQEPTKEKVETEDKEKPKEKPHESLKVAVLRRVKGEMHQEPMTLIDPVTGLLTPMRECEEGKYIPVSGNQAKQVQNKVQVNQDPNKIQVTQIQVSPILNKIQVNQAQNQIQVNQTATIQTQAVQSQPCAIVSTVASTQKPLVSTQPTAPTKQKLQSRKAHVLSFQNASKVVVSQPVQSQKPVSTSTASTPSAFAQKSNQLPLHVNVSLPNYVPAHVSPRPSSKPMATPQLSPNQISLQKQNVPSKTMILNPIIQPPVNIQYAHVQPTVVKQPSKQQPVVVKTPQQLQQQPLVLSKSLVGKHLNPQGILPGSVPSTYATVSRVVQSTAGKEKVEVSQAIGKAQVTTTQQRHVLPAGMSVPAYEASLHGDRAVFNHNRSPPPAHQNSPSPQGEGIAAHFPGLRPHDVTPYMSPHVVYHQLLRHQYMPRSPMVSIEKRDGDGQEGEEAPVTSPPLELRRPGSVGLALNRSSTVPLSLQSPQDRTTDSPQVYGMHTARMQHYHQGNRIFDHEPPPAHRGVTSHGSLTSLTNERGYPLGTTELLLGAERPMGPIRRPDRPLSNDRSYTSLGNPERPLSAHSVGHLGPLGTPDRPLSMHISDRPPIPNQTLNNELAGGLGAAIAGGINPCVVDPVTRNLIPEAPASHRGIQVATPPHASKVPPNRWNLHQLLLQHSQHFPIMWQGLLALKNDQAAVQMYYVSGNEEVAKLTLSQSTDSSTPALRIFQRMRLEPPQVEGVMRKMQLEKEHCMLLALPFGKDHEDAIEQHSNLHNGLISYLTQKQAAGIINVAAPGTKQPPAYVVHIFPSCDFVNENLRREAPELLERLGDIAHLLIIITTV